MKAVSIPVDHYQHLPVSVLYVCGILNSSDATKKYPLHHQKIVSEYNEVSPLPGWSFLTRKREGS